MIGYQNTSRPSSFVLTPEFSLKVVDYTQVNWSAAVETLFRVSGLSDEQRAVLMAPDMAVSLQCRDFFVELGNLLSTTPARQ